MSLWVRTPVRQHYVMKVVSDLRQVGGFLHQQNWPPRYNLYIVESDIKHHNPNPNQ